MFDPIDPKELQQALYASAAAVSIFQPLSMIVNGISRKLIFHQIPAMMMIPFEPYLVYRSVMNVRATIHSNHISLSLSEHPYTTVC